MGSEKHKYCTLRQFAYIVSLLLLTTSCNWVEDDRDDCPYGFWLKLHYTYNILDVEAGPEYLKDASVYVYDTLGNYVTRIDATLPQLQTHEHCVEVKGIPEGDYQFVVWSGRNEYATTGDMQEMDKFRLFLEASNGNPSKLLPDLFHGYLPRVHFDDAYAVHDVYMTKNTNEITCLLVAVDGNEELKKDDYTMAIETSNGTMDAMNKLVSEETIVYEPYTSELATVDDDEYAEPLKGVKYSISTLRLMEDRNCQLVMKKKSETDGTDETKFRISLPEWIGIIGPLQTKTGKQLSLQEYLDRQDYYAIVLFLSGADLSNIQVYVKKWKPRTTNNFKLKM